MEDTKGRTVSFALGYILGYKGTPWLIHLGYAALVIASFFVGRKLG